MPLHRFGPLLLLAFSLSVAGELPSMAFAAAPGLYDVAAAGQREARRQRRQAANVPAAEGGPRTFKVGPGAQYSRPSDVVKLVRSGDRVEIAPGTYRDCVIWPRGLRRVTIEGDNATITGDTCGGKALFVVLGNDFVIRGLTFQGAKARDQNGAGIRAQGQSITVENSRFIDNQNGILASAIPGSEILVRNSYFKGNGACIAACAHGIYVGRVSLLRVEGSEFFETHRGHHIKSRSAKTEIANNFIHDGPGGDSSFLVDIPNGGEVLITGNRLEKGPKAENRGAAISIGAAAQSGGFIHPNGKILVENNDFKSELPNQTNFVRNRSGTPAVIRSNKISGNVRELFEGENVAQRQ